MTALAPIRDAATVILLRRQAAEVLVLMGMRGAGAVFMPSKYVFPGGAVDADDATARLAAPLAEPHRARLVREPRPGTRPDPDAIAAAALRELAEETGVTARITALIDVVDGIFAESRLHYVLIDYAAEWVSGEPVAGDDALEARFVPLDQVDELIEWSETRRIIALAAAQR